MNYEKFVRQPDTKEGLATIPYIVHELRMYKAYQRENKWQRLAVVWKKGFVISNCLWITGAILSFLLR